LRQEGLLRTYASGFDGGNTDLALPMAVSIRVLVHDTRTSTSLLEHLGVKHRILFLDTAQHIIPGNLLTNLGLVIAEVTVGEYVAPLDMERPIQNPPSRFAAWWKTPIAVDTRRSEFSRKDLVLAVANKLGGAHVDSTVPEDIDHFRLPDSLGWRTVGPLGDGQFNSPLPPSIRQIAHELIRTIESQVKPSLG